MLPCFTSFKLYGISISWNAHLIFIFFFLYSCMPPPPVNLSFENAAVLKKGQVELRASYAKYGTDSSGKMTNNLGVHIGLGLSHRYTMQFQYEYLNNVYQEDPFNGDLNDMIFNDFNYFAINSKIEINPGTLSIGIPIAFYIPSGILLDESIINTWTSLGPRLYITHRFNKSVELNTVPKINFLVGNFGLGAQIIPGLSIGLGLSSNLDAWAIRPEIGFARHPSIGIGYTYYFQKRKIE